MQCRSGGLAPLTRSPTVAAVSSSHKVSSISSSSSKAQHPLSLARRLLGISQTSECVSACGQLASLPRRKGAKIVCVCVAFLGGGGGGTPPQIPSGRVKGHAPVETCGFNSIFSFCFRCTRPCRFRSSLRANRLPQTSQENGFSPV